MTAPLSDLEKRRRRDVARQAVRGSWREMSSVLFRVLRVLWLPAIAVFLFGAAFGATQTATWLSSEIEFNWRCEPK